MVGSRLEEIHSTLPEETPNTVNTEYNKDRYNKATNKHSKRNAENKDTCYYCGRTYPHKGKCPAEGATCHSCGKSNHFSNVCRSKNTDQSKTNHKHQKPNTKVNEIHTEISNNADENNEYSRQQMQTSCH